MAKSKHKASHAPAHKKGTFKGTVRIKVRDVAGKFGHHGEVIHGSTVLHQTSLHAHGQKAGAYEAAYKWAQARGYQVK